MTWLFHLLIGLYTAVAGFFGGALVGTQCARWFRITSAEGASGYYTAMFAIAGGIAGLILGLIVATVVSPQNGAGVLKAAGIATLGVALLGVSVLGISRLLADVPPGGASQPWFVDLELRLPPGAANPLEEAGALSIELHQIVDNRSRTWRYGTIDRERTRLVDGRWLVAARAPLFTTRGSRLLRVAFVRDNKDLAHIPLPIPPAPKDDSFAWSEWSDATADGAPVLAHRFRVQKQTPPPPPPSREQQLEEADRKAREAFDAIPLDAPPAVWLPFTQDPRLRDAALARILARPGLVGEITPLLVDSDAELARDALRMIGQLPEPSADWIPPVAAAGRDLAERLRKVNATPVEEDPSYNGAAEISIRFSAWMTAARALRTKAGADFVPELRTLLELSRVRTESIALRMDVRRVASYHLHEWAGVPPHPEDPPPR